MPSRFVFESSTKTSDSSLSFFDEVLAAPSSNNHQKKKVWRRETLLKNVTF